MPALDLKLVNAHIVDGTGQPGYDGAIGVIGGQIVAIGHEAADLPALETIDAAGHVASPGFVDIHTHYDAQLFWDPLPSVSPYHGVTTTVIGNCGFGVAPAWEQHHERLLRTLERVEGMPFDSTLAGLGPHWTFETFPEFLDALDARGPGVNVAALIPHTTLRIYVMGEDADQREATASEIATMADLVREAMSAGAWGLSTSNHHSHVGYQNRLVPSLFASFEEYRQLILAMAESGRGTVESTRGEILDLQTMAALIRETGRPITLSALMADEEGKGSHHAVLQEIEGIQREGLALWPQVSPRPITLRFTLTRPTMFTHTAPGTVPGAAFLDDLFTDFLAQTDTDSQVAILGDRAFRTALEQRTSSDSWVYLWDKIVVSEMPGHPELTDVGVTRIARDRRVHPSEVILDLGIESNLSAVFASTHLNGDEEAVAELLKHPGTRIGVTDAGAHVAELCDACYPTHVLGHWVRERNEFSLESAVAMLSAQTAQVYGIARGTLKTGAAADIVVFDPATVAATPLRRVHDLPGGAPRLVSDAIGVDHVVVNGLRLITGGELVSQHRAGRVLRSSIVN